MEIAIKKGLDLPLDGKPDRRLVDLRGTARRYAVKPTDVVGFEPRLLVGEGDTVGAGQPLVVDKHDSLLTLPSPVEGTVVAIVRGEKRRLEAIVVESGKVKDDAAAEPSTDRRQLSPASPCWWMLRERPFGTIAHPDHQAKGIFISLLDTNPLAPDMNYALKGREHDFEAGLQVLSQWAHVHVCATAEGWRPQNTPTVTVHTMRGPHPAGNVGTQIAHISPIGKGEYVWTVGAQDVATIGHWANTGEYRPERVISVGGPAARSPHYYRVLAGTSLCRVVEAQLMNRQYPAPQVADAADTRIVSGSVLSGKQVAPDGFLGMYDQQVTLLPEGNHYEFMGWLMPGLNKHSFSKTFLSGILAPFKILKDFGMPDIPYRFDTNMHGSVRPFLFTGQFERVFPFDIYPMQLIKACIVGDTELQEKLGIYEVEPEDFALCEYIDPSKTEIQTIIREALEVLRKETLA